MPRQHDPAPRHHEPIPCHYDVCLVKYQLFGDASCEVAPAVLLNAGSRPRQRGLRPAHPSPICDLERATAKVMRLVPMAVPARSAFPHRIAGVAKDSQSRWGETVPKPLSPTQAAGAEHAPPAYPRQFMQCRCELSLAFWLKTCACTRHGSSEWGSLQLAMSLVAPRLAGGNARHAPG